MAALAIAAAGAGIGSAIGGTFLGVSAMGWGWMAGSLVGNLLVGGKNTQGPRLGDLRVTGTEYGQCVPWLAGAPRISGQIIWASTLREIATTQSAGKGGGPSVTSYSYEGDLLILLAENVTAGVSRVWLNNELVFDGATTRAGVWADIIVYTGADTQLPDPTYEAAVGTGNAPAYRGRTTVLVRGLQFGNSKTPPNLTFEIGVSGELAGDVGFLCQFESMADADTIVSEIGPDPVRISPYTLGLSTVNYKFPDRSAAGSWSSGNVPANLANAWRWEGWVWPTSTDYTSSVFRVEVPGGLEYIDVNFGDPSLDLTFNIFYGGSLIGGGITSLNESVFPRPTAARWYHIAVQYNGSSSINIFFDGRFVASIAGRFSSSYSALVFKAGRVGYSAYWDSTICRLNLPAAEVWPEGVYTVPTQPFSLYSGDTVGWYDTTPDPLSLKNAVDALMARAGYAADEWDSSALAAITRPLRALALSQVASTRSALESLMSAFFFYAVKTDRILFLPRASTPAATLARDELAAAADTGGESEAFAPRFGSDLELPAQVALSYNNMLADCNVGTEYSDRLLGEQTSVQTVQLGIGMEPAEAKLVADAMLMDQVNAAVTASISVPALRRAALRCGDVILVPDRAGTLYRMRITGRADAGMVSTLELAQDDPAALQSAAVTDTGYALTETVRQMAPTWWQAMDIPLLRDADDGPGYYVAMGPNRAAADDIWRGAVFVRAWTTEAWENAAESDTAATLGATTSSLPAWNGRNVFDEATVLTVRVSGELASSTRDAMLADLSINTLLVGSEVLRFRLATLTGTTDGENDYTLTGLLRAQLGTEWAAASTAAAGARVVLLSGTALRRVADQTSQLGLPCDVKAVSNGLLLTSATAEVFTDTGVCLKPLAPVHGRALHSGGDLALSWQRRTRLSTRVGGASGTVVPLGEAAEAYRLRIYSGATLLRTVDTTAPAHTYTAADQAADGLASASAISITVAQVSATVGEGYAHAFNATTP